ncbi:MAG: hypothetical protein ISS77_00785 [Phycisphaerae bacterium]|nr:hypothetical protein [Phycisphaerae bacterium]
MNVTVRIFYSDGEVADKALGSLTECLEYIRVEIIDKKEHVDDIKIHIGNE